MAGSLKEDFAIYGANERFCTEKLHSIKRLDDKNDKSCEIGHLNDYVSHESQYFIFHIMYNKVESYDTHYCKKMILLKSTEK